MVNFREIEEKVVEAAKTVLHEAEANEPTIGGAVRIAMEGAGVPAPLATTVVSIVEGILAHFQNEHATTVVATPPAASEPPATPEPPASDVSTASVAPASEAAAPADPFAPAGTGQSTT